MTFKKYPLNLQLLAEYIKDYLSEKSKAILTEKAGLLATSIKDHRKKRIVWTLNIPLDSPLEFIKGNDCNYKLHIDLSCRIEGVVDSIKSDKILEYKEYSVTIRVWSHDKKVSFRKPLDASALKSDLKKQDWKRVVLRFHIDRKNPNTTKPEPLYHLHFGGITQDNEYSWFSKSIKEPRFLYFPLDLVLLCEFILTNFYPKESNDLREKPEWKSLVRKSQEIYLKPHFEMYSKYLCNENDTLLGHLTKLN